MESGFLIFFHRVLVGLIVAALIAESVARYLVDPKKVRLEDEATRRWIALRTDVPSRVMTPLGQKLRKIVWNLWGLIFVMIATSFYFQKRG